MQKKYLEAGEIVSTHGVQGEVKILPWADLCAVRLPDVHSQKMVRHAGSLLFRRQSGCSQSRLYLRDDSAAVSGHPLYCALYHPSAL